MLPLPPHRKQAGTPGKPYVDRRVRRAALTRGVVFAVHFSDEPQERAMPARAHHHPGGCTVDLLMRGGGVLWDVPVMQRGSSVGNGAPWVPRAATRTLSGAPLGWAPTVDVPSVDPEDTDGEWVVVDFFDGDPLSPIVIGSTVHPRTRRPQEGWAPKPLPDPSAEVEHLSGLPDGLERFVAQAGTVVRIDRAGNVRVDTTRAGVDDDGETPVVEPGVVAGHVVVDLAADAHLVLRFDGQRQLDLRAGGDAGPQLDVFGGGRALARLGDFVAVDAASSPAFMTWVAAVTAAVNALPALLETASADRARLDALSAWAAAPPPAGSGRPPLPAAAAGVPLPPLPPGLPAVTPVDAVPGAPAPAGPQLVGTVATASERMRGA